MCLQRSTQRKKKCCGFEKATTIIVDLFSDRLLFDSEQSFFLFQTYKKREFLLYLQIEPRDVTDSGIVIDNNNGYKKNNFSHEMLAILVS
jgi:hypothetical protein